MTARVSLRSAATEAQILLWRLGWCWPVAVAVLALAAAFHFAAFVPARAALAETKAELAQAAVRRTAAPPPAPPASEEQQLEALQASLRGGPDAAELIRRFGELARAEQIALAQGDYQQQFHPATQLLQLQVTQPVKASYPQLKRYVESVLRSMPNVSLDQIAARRDNVGQSQLEVRLRWSVWIHAPRPARTEGRT